MRSIVPLSGLFLFCASVAVGADIRVEKSGKCQATVGDRVLFAFPHSNVQSRSLQVKMDDKPVTLQVQFTHLGITGYWMTAIYMAEKAGTFRFEMTPVYNANPAPQETRKYTLHVSK